MEQNSTTSRGYSPLGIVAWASFALCAWCIVFATATAVLTSTRQFASMEPLPTPLRWEEAR